MNITIIFIFIKLYVSVTLQVPVVCIIISEAVAIILSSLLNDIIESVDSISRDGPDMPYVTGFGKTLRKGSARNARF